MRNLTILITGDVSISRNMVIGGDVSISRNMTIGGDVQIAKGSGYPFYNGPYVVAPSSQTQTLNTKDKITTENITINPIPEYYGLITYNGLSIKVS